MNKKRVLWVVMSAALHGVVVLFLLQAVFSPNRLFFLGGQRDVALSREDVTYVLPSRPLPRPELPRVPRAVGSADTRPMPAAPVMPPSRLPAVDSGSAVVTLPDADAVSRSGAAGAAAPPALVPSYKDSRILGGGLTMPVPTLREGLAGLRFRLDSAVTATADSLAALGDPTDWTIGEGNKKFGMDPQWIYLGPVKIPTALLAFVPINVQSNPNARENARWLGTMAAEVRDYAGSPEVQDQIKAIRARVERQRAARLAASRNGGGSGGSGGGSGSRPPGR